MEQPQEKKRRVWVVHPLLFAAAPVVMLFAHNRTRVPLDALPGPLLMCLAFVAVAWAAFGFMLRSLLKGGVLASALALLFLSFGHFATAAGWYTRKWGLLELSPDHLAWIVLGIALLIVLILGGWLRRTKRSLAGLNLFLNVSAATLVAMALFNIGRMLSNAASPVWVAASGPRDLRKPEPIAVAEVADRPDVYLIMSDAHARADVLNDLYGQDGEAFLAGLESRGFKIARNSWANYSVTVLAAPAMFDYDYVHELDGKTEATYPQMHERLRYSRLLARLKAHGYTIIGFETGYEFTRLTNADRIYRPRGFTGDEFYYAFLKTTPAPLLFGQWAMISEGAQKRVDMRFLLDTVPIVADDPAPTFAWVHLTIPHSPFVFGAEGQNVERRYRHLEDFGSQRRTEQEQQEYRTAYRDQTTYADKAILRLVDEVLARSAEPPIILLLSDHGSRLKMVRDENWRQTDLREAMANLTACYFPDGRGADALYDSITPVNVVRVMLNEYFAADLPLLEDRSFHSPFGTPFWLFEDVTDQLRGGESAAAPSGATE